LIEVALTQEEKNVMETESNIQPTNHPELLNAAQPVAAVVNSNAATARHAHVNPAACANCGATMESNGTGIVQPSFVFAIGRVEMRFGTLGVEKEFTQATGRADTKGLTDREAIHAVLSVDANRYLIRQVCWVFTIEGLETYILVPKDPADYDQLRDAVRPRPSPLDVDVVIGVRGPIAPPEMCNGLTIPIVFFDQIYSFDRDALWKALPQAKQGGRAKANDNTTSAEELFDRIKLMADNAGSTDEHRALNYLLVRSADVYDKVATAFGREASLTAVDVQPSSLSSTRNVLDVIFSFTDRKTDVIEKLFTRVDVTEEFPFLVTKMSPYFDR
jgi:hypothetical protein